jgi:hypothetical protein
VTNKVCGCIQKGRVLLCGCVLFGRHKESGWVPPGLHELVVALAVADAHMDQSSYPYSISTHKSSRYRDFVSVHTIYAEETCWPEAAIS